MPQVPATATTAQTLLVALFPNPAADATQIHWVLESEQNMEVRLLDLNGRLLWS